MGGQIDLRSGAWTWTRFDVIDCSTRRLDRVIIRLALEGVADSVMRIDLDPQGGDPELVLISRLARHPRIREVAADGESWEFITLNRARIAMAVGLGLLPEPYRVSYRSSTGPFGTGELPSGIRLGEATDDELRAIIQRGKQR